MANMLDTVADQNILRSFRYKFNLNFSLSQSNYKQGALVQLLIEIVDHTILFAALVLQ